MFGRRPSGRRSRPQRRILPAVPLRPAATLAAALAATIAFSTCIRTHTTFTDPAFAAAHANAPRGLLKSDPALLAYLTQRILDSGGLPPDDFRADPRIQHPDTTDIPAEFTVGQEFLLAWTYRLFGADLPLVDFAVRLMSFLASLAAVGLCGLVWTRTRSVAWTVLALCAFATLPANYRTIGFILVREDLSFPLFALHLWLLARAERRRTPSAFLLAGLVLAGALATWHAMGFFVAVELGCLVLAFLISGKSPFQLPGAWAVLVGPVLAATLVPALRANAFLVGLPMQVAWALLAVALVRARRPLARAPALGLAAATWAATFGLAALLVPGRSGYAHVYEMLVAKLIHLGRKPLDPATISFDARLLWQGPFETLPLVALIGSLGLGALLLAGAFLCAARARNPLPPFDRWLVGLTLAALPTAWLIERTVILAGLCVPAVAAILFARVARVRLARGVFVAAVALQLLWFWSWAGRTAISWYQPPGRQAEIAALVEWIADNVDSTEPIAADFMNSTAILAQTGNPVVLQPKYETEASRRKAQAFLETFFHGSPADLARLVRERFESRYLLVDRHTLALSTWTAGLAAGALKPGSAAEVFLSQEDGVLSSVPGFELVYRSPATIRQVDGRPYDFFRLYRLP